MWYYLKQYSVWAPWSLRTGSVPKNLKIAFWVADSAVGSHFLLDCAALERTSSLADVTSPWLVFHSGLWVFRCGSQQTSRRRTEWISSPNTFYFSTSVFRFGHRAGRVSHGGWVSQSAGLNSAGFLRFTCQSRCLPRHFRVKNTFVVVKCIGCLLLTDWDVSVSRVEKRCVELPLRRGGAVTRQ